MKFTVAAASTIILGALAISGAPTQQQKRSTKGVATYYEQGGNPGSCGQTHSDSSKIVAVTPSLAGSSCGKQVTIQSGSKQVVATVADTCPSCDYGHLDLSKGAFSELADFEKGEVDINWWFS